MTTEEDKTDYIQRTREIAALAFVTRDFKRAKRECYNLLSLLPNDTSAEWMLEEINERERV